MIHDTRHWAVVEIAWLERKVYFAAAKQLLMVMLVFF